MKKILALTCALGMLASVGIASAAEVSTTSPNQIQKIAKASQPTYRASIKTARTEVPKDAVLYVFKTEKNIDTLRFRDNANFTDYEVEVDNVLNKVVELEINGSNIVGSTTVRLNSTDIFNIVKEAYPDAQNIIIEKEQEGNNFYYEADFFIQKGKVELKINPMTGAIAHTEIDFK